MRVIPFVKIYICYQTITTNTFMDEKTLQQKIDAEVYKRRYSASSLEDLISVTSTSQSLTYLFKEMSNNLNLKKLLFLHRVDLFGVDTDVHIPYLPLCSIPKGIRKKIDLSQPSKTLQHIVSNEFSSMEVKGQGFLKQKLGLNDEILGDAMDISLYMVIHYLRQNEKLRNLITSPDFSYIEMKKEMGDFKTALKLEEYFAYIAANFNNEKIVDPIVLKKFEKVVLNSIANFMSSIDESLEQISNLTPDVMLTLHANSILWIGNLLSKTAMKYETYIEVLDDLYRFKLIENRSIMTWCDSCSIESPTYSATTAKVAPQKFMKARRCLTCSKLELFSSFYGITKELREMMFSKDGILPVYFSWLLAKKGIQFTTSKYAGEYESDILIDNSIIVESKMLKMDKDDEAIETNINKVIVQLSNQIQSFKTDGVNIREVHLLWNRGTLSDDIRQKIQRKHPEICEKYNFTIISLDQIEAFVERMPYRLLPSLS